MRGSTAKVVPKPKSLSCASIYLLIYNVVQVAGWLYIAFKSCFYMLAGSHDNLYSEVDTELKIFQTLATVEIIHAALGFVKSNPVVTAVQVYSRVFLLWGVLNISDKAKEHFGFSMLLFAWTVTEIIRYAFYAGNIINKAPFFITYARYTFFVVLYPVGVTGELLSVYSSLHEVEKERLFTYSLPNPLNISFEYYSFLILMMLAYVPVFPKLYLHMFVQRKKVLGNLAKKDQ